MHSCHATHDSIARVSPGAVGVDVYRAKHPGQKSGSSTVRRRGLLTIKPVARCSLLPGRLRPPQAHPRGIPRTFLPRKSHHYGTPPPQAGAEIPQAQTVVTTQLDSIPKQCLFAIRSFALPSVGCQIHPQTLADEQRRSAVLYHVFCVQANTYNYAFRPRVFTRGTPITCNGGGSIKPDLRHYGQARDLAGHPRLP